MGTPFVRPVCNFAQRITLGLFADWKVMGRENVPPKGPLIIVANHQGNFDPPVMGVSIPRRTWFLAKVGIFRGPAARWFLGSWGAFPLNREGADVRAYRWILSKLEQGQAVVLFPEGTRNRGGMKKAKAGVVQLALKTQALLLPVGITGTERIGTWARVLNPTGRIRVNIGTVFSIPSIEGKPSAEVLDSMTDMVMRRVAALLPESYQGVYKVKPESRVAAQKAGSPGFENVTAPPT